jgi:hypothetical protein
MKNAFLSLALAFPLATACAPTGTALSPATPSAPDPLNATFRVERDTVALANGRAEREAAPGSATKVVTTLGDQRATGDLDGDGRPDSAVILVRQPGGSGTFYYVATLLGRADGATATPAILLGDRITVTAVRLDGAAIVVDMLGRAAGDPLTASPTVPIVKRFVVDRGELVAR